MPAQLLPQNTAPCPRCCPAGGVGKQGGSGAGSAERRERLLEEGEGAEATGDR